MLEDELFRLTQTVLELQSSLTGVNENLKLTVQEDASRTPVSWLNNLHDNPELDSAVDGDSDTIYSSELPPEEKDGQKTNLEGQNEKESGYERQLKPLQEAAQGPTITMPSSHLYQTYIDARFEALKQEIMEGFEKKMSDLKNSCEYKLMDIQQHCDDLETSCLGIRELVAEKENYLRKEIEYLHTSIIQAPSNQSFCCNATKHDDFERHVKHLDQKIDRIADASRMLNARLDNEIQHISAPDLDGNLDAKWEELEARINTTEKNAEEHCFYIERSLHGVIATEVDGVKDLFYEKLQALEDRLDATVSDVVDKRDPDERETGLGSLLHSDTGSGNEHLASEMNSMKRKLQSIEHLCGQKCQPVQQNVEGLQKDIEKCNTKYNLLFLKTEDNSGLLKSLNGSLHEKVTLIKGSQRDIQKLQKDLRIVRFGLNNIDKDIKILQGGLITCRQQLLGVNSTCENAQLDVIRRMEEMQKAVGNQITHPTNSCCNKLQEKLEQLNGKVSDDLNQCKEKFPSVSNLEDRVSHIETVCEKLDSVTGSIQSIKEGLNKHVSSLWNCVNQMNRTTASHSKDIFGLQNSVQQFHHQFHKLTIDFQDLMKAARKLSCL